MSGDRTGTILAGCKIGGLLGRGSMGEVWRATHLALKRPVALKVLAVRDADAEEAILREARALAQVEHPNVVRVYDVKFEGEAVCMILELLQGRTLRERLEKDGPLAGPDLYDVADGVARGLGAIHAAGLVHRDLKLDNVMLTDAGAVKITDFGVAVGPGGTDAYAGAVVGTPAYISPEQWLGRPLDARADLYALGVLLYACASGRPPFREKDAEGYRHAHLKTLVPRPKEIDPGVVDVLLKLLRKDRMKRYANVEEFLEDVERLRRGETPLATSGKAVRCGFCAEDVVPVKGRCPTCHEAVGSSGPIDVGLRANEFACPGCGSVVERGARACPGCGKGFCRNCLVKLAAAAGLCAGCGGR